MESTNSFGYWIRRQRKTLDLTQQSLAERVGCSLAEIKKIEGDERKPSRQIAERLADSLGIPANQREIFVECARGLRTVDQLPLAREPGVPTATRTRMPKSSHHNLPVQLTSFIGRKKEIIDVIHLLERARLVTLIGSGGTGKTRLSIQVANELLDKYRHGVWIVELAPILDPLLIPRITALAIGLRGEPRHPVVDMLSDYLHEKKMLLLLDNCEHLIEACAEFSDLLLHACPHIRILATSREALGIAGETTYLVPSLKLPEMQNLPTVHALSQSEAVQLFIERATEKTQSFIMTDENASSIAQICYHLDGIPLAIELAAGKIRALSIQQIAQRLDDRFHLLTGGSRTELPRHQTLQAAVEWSYNLLSPKEQTLFRRLSVFVNGWTLEAAEEVCVGDGVEPYDILDLLTHLVNKSLVLVTERSQSGETRYHMLETIRQYAREKLFASGATEIVGGHHLEFFLRFAEEAEPKLHGSEQLTWFNHLEAEHDNFRAALDWAKASGSAQEGLRLASALRLFWYVRGYWSEGRKWLTEMLTQPGAWERTLPRAGALAMAASLATYQGDLAIGQALAMESIMLCRQLDEEGKYILAFALGTLGWNLIGQDADSAHAALEESLAIARQIGYKYVIATSLNALGNILQQQGAHSAAQTMFEESVATSQDEGDRRYSAAPLASLGFVLYKQGDPISARSNLDQALMIAREMGDERHVVWALISLGDIEISEGHYKQAQSNYAESLAVGRKIGGKDGIAECLEALATLLVTKNYNLAENRNAAKLFGAAETLRESFNIFRESSLRISYDRIVDILSERLGKTTFETAWAQGKAMTIEQAIDLALEE